MIRRCPVGKDPSGQRRIIQDRTRYQSRKTRTWSCLLFPEYEYIHTEYSIRTDRSSKF